MYKVWAGTRRSHKNWLPGLNTRPVNYDKGHSLTLPHACNLQADKRGGSDLGNMGCQPTNETVTHRLIDSESTIVLGQYVGSDPGNMGSDSANENVTHTTVLGHQVGSDPGNSAVVLLMRL